MTLRLVHSSDGPPEVMLNRLGLYCSLIGLAPGDAVSLHSDNAIWPGRIVAIDTEIVIVREDYGGDLRTLQVGTLPAHPFYSYRSEDLPAVADADGLAGHAAHTMLGPPLPARLAVA